MKRLHTYICLFVLTVFAATVFISCPASPPMDPMEEYNPNGAPNAPKNVKASNGYEGTITVSWDPVENATSYQVWRIENTKYGTIEDDGESLSSISDLQQRGFSLVQSLSSGTTEYSFNQSGNKGYVFSVIAVRNPSDATSSSGLLYSEPSEFVEGGTLTSRNSIDISGIANANEVMLYWKVPNIFSILEQDKSLYEYDFSILYRDPTQSSDWKTAKSDITDFSISLSTDEYAFGVDSTVYFRIEMNVYEGAKGESAVINTPYSIDYPVLTDSTLNPQPITSVAASQGTLADGIEVTWIAPRKPANLTDVSNAFKIERCISESSEWSVILLGEDNESAGVSGNGTSFTWVDTSVEANTRYQYRITNGYKNADGAVIYEGTDDGEKVVSDAGWKLWVPEDVKFTVSGQSSQSAFIKIAWNYNPPEAEEGVSWKISISDWDQLTGQTSYSSRDVAAGSNSDEFTLENADGDYHEYRFTLIQVFNGEEVNSFTVENSDSGTDDFVSLGTKIDTEFIKEGSLTATTDYLGVVKLSWEMSESALQDSDATYSFSVSIDNGASSVLNDVKEDGSRRYVMLDTDKESSYRISCTRTSSEMDPLTQNLPEQVIGSVLTKPESFSATDGDYANKIAFSWAGKTSENIKYEVYQKGLEEGDDAWKKVSDSTSNSSEIASAGDDTDGTVYDFKVRAYNKEQIKTDSDAYIESDVDQGNVFGIAGMNLTATIAESPDTITLRWNHVNGTGHYLIYRSDPNSKEGFSKLDGQINVTSGMNGELDYEDTAIASMTPSEANPEPLSATYYYKVLPVKEGTTDTDAEANLLASIKEAEGSLFGPPANIQATKGGLIDAIRVTWDNNPHATSYNIQRYTKESGNLVIDGSFVEKQVTGTTFTDESSIIGSMDYYYSVQSIKGSDESLYQNGFRTTENIFGESEDANLGYSLVAPSSLTAETVESGGKYQPYVRLTWPAVKGASRYMLHNSIDGGTGVELDITDVHSDDGWDIKDSSQPGYLGYSDGIYTYNDPNTHGTMKDSLTFTNSITAIDSENKETNPVSDDTQVTRALKAEEYVNFVNQMLQAPLKEADETVHKNMTAFDVFELGGNKFSHDWFLYSVDLCSNDISYQNGTAVVHLQSERLATEYNPSINYLSLNKFHIDSFGISLTTSKNIEFDVQEGDDRNNSKSGDSGGTDYLILLGYNGNGTIDVSMDNQKYNDAIIQYRNIFPLFEDYDYFSENDYGTFGSGKGVYTVTIDGKDAETVIDREDIVRPFISPSR